MLGFGRFRFLLRALLVCACLDAALLQAQTPPQMEMTVPKDGEGLMTLHAYSNLIQMPVLVLSQGLLTLPPIKPELFSMSIDNGPRYRPAYVRPEGADPISLTILLDFVGSASELMPKIAETLDSLTMPKLTPRDHVSLLVMQCALLDEMRDVPAEPGLLRLRIAKAVTDWDERSRARHRPPCEEKLHLWDTLGFATLRLGELPGRRVIIAVTDGIDRGSRNSPAALAIAMQKRAVTLFGLRPEQATDRTISNRGKGGAAMAYQAMTPGVTTDEPFERLSELSGGLGVPANRWNAGKQFAHIPELLRGRYILEFPRPWNTSAGSHVIDVQVAKGNDFIRSSGTSVPLPDPKIAADPTTLPNDPALTPQIGKLPKGSKPPPR